MTYQRPLPHLKHVGTFGQIYHRRVAERAGFDDALLTTAEGVVSETTIANVGFLRRGTVVWPDAPHLRGTGMHLLDAALTESIPWDAI